MDRISSHLTCEKGHVLFGLGHSSFCMCVLNHFSCKRVDPKSSHHKENILKDCCCCLVAEPCPSLCEPKDCCLTGSSVCGISQASVLLEWVAISPPGNLSNSGIKPASHTLAGGFLTAEPPRKPCFFFFDSNIY